MQRSVVSRAGISFFIAAAAAALPWRVCAAPQSVQIDSSYTIVVGSDPLEETAGADLKSYLADQVKGGVRGPVLEGDYRGGAHAIFIGTVQDNKAIAAEAAKGAFDFKSADPESYHGAFRGGNLWIVGASAKGAMNGVFRFEDRRSLAVAGFDVAESPAFHLRVGGHIMNQTPPPNWSPDDQGRYYAHHYINVVWGEKRGAPLSYDVRKKWGLGLMVEQVFPPVSDDWMKDPAHASAVYYQSAKKSQGMVVSPFDPVGREAYAAAFRQLFAENPDIRILYAAFGDYDRTPDENSINVATGQPFGHSQTEAIEAILGIMKQVAGDRDCITVGWMWHSFYGHDDEVEPFMKQLAAQGYGPMYNEHGNSDDWIIKRDNFDDTALATNADGKTAYGSEYLPLVSAGGACESINPVIGFPVPDVAATKISRIANIGVQNFCIWWSGCEGWVYEPNNEVVSELIWNPKAFDPTNPDPYNPATGDKLLRHIADRDFGALAPDVLNFWKLLDHAVITDAPLYKKPSEMPPPNQDGLHIYDWYQRMGIFTEPVFGAGYPAPLTPTDIAARSEVSRDKSWMHDPLALENYADVLKNLNAALAALDTARKKPMPAAVAKRIDDMYDWTDLYRYLLTTQYDFMRAVTIMVHHKGEPVDSPEIRTEFAPVITDETANDQAIIRLIPSFAPNFNIQLAQEGVWENTGTGQPQVEIDSLQSKMAAMRLYLSGARNIALGKPVTASSQGGENPEEHAHLSPRNVTDGDGETRWGSDYTDNQWIYIDLGSVQPVDTVVLRWIHAYAKAFDLQIANDLTQPDPWKTVYHTTNGRDGDSIIALPPGTNTRYIRMLGIKRGTGWGYALTEFEAYGPAAHSAGL